MSNLISALTEGVSRGQFQFPSSGSSRTTIPEGVVTSCVCSDSQRSFRPSPSVSFRRGFVPSSASSRLVRPSRSGSPSGPLSGFGNVSFCSPVSLSVSTVATGISSHSTSVSPSPMVIQGSPVSNGSSPFSISHPSSSPSPSVSASCQLVPYNVLSILSAIPSPSQSHPIVGTSGGHTLWFPSFSSKSSTADSKPPLSVLERPAPTTVYRPAKQRVAVIAATAYWL